MSTDQIRRIGAWACCLSTLAAMGCVAPGHKACHDCCSPPAVVHTGGPYAIEQTLEIPDEGLALGPVVEGALRAGWSTDAARPAIIVETRSLRKVQAPLPVVEVKITVDDRILKTVRKVLIASPPNTEAYASELVSHLRLNGIEGERLANEVLQTLKTLETSTESDGQQIAFDRLQKYVSEYSKPDYVTRELHRELSRPSDTAIAVVAERVNRLSKSKESTNEASGFSVEAITSRVRLAWESGDLAQAPTLEKRKERIVAIVFGTAAAAPTSAGEAPPPASAPPSPAEEDAGIGTATDDFVVVLTRRSRHSLIFPLDLVLRASLGDVWLVDGDRISITSFRQTQVSMPLPVDPQGGVVLTSRVDDPQAKYASDIRRQGFSSLASEKAAQQPTSDIAIVRRVNAAGAVDDFYLPVIHRGDEPGAEFALRCLNAVNLDAGDHVHFDNLEATTLIQESRARARQTRMALLAPKELCSPRLLPDPWGLRANWGQTWDDGVGRQIRSLNQDLSAWTPW